MLPPALCLRSNTVRRSEGDDERMIAVDGQFKNSSEAFDFRQDQGQFSAALKIKLLGLKLPKFFPHFTPTTHQDMTIFCLSRVFPD